MKRVAMIGSPEKTAVAETMKRAAAWLEKRAALVYCEQTYDASPVLALNPDFLVVLGGDGTLIAAVHSLRDRQIPIVGINLGKLGFLAEFTIDQLETNGDFLFRDALPVTRRVLLNVRFERSGSPAVDTPALNDCVILAGQPFRMIDLALEIDGDALAEVRGDGLIISTASGSTAHNLAAGGPILEPTAELVVMTSICPHTLTFRPLVIAANRRIVITAKRCNEGTTAVVDGRSSRRIASGDRIIVNRFNADFLLIRNPQRSEWFSLRNKLLWGRDPRSGGVPQ